MEITADQISQYIVKIQQKYGKKSSAAITGNTDLSKQLQFDDRQKRDLLRTIEEAYEIRFPDYGALATIGEVERKVQELLAEKKRKANRIFTIPNLLSIFRLLLIPVYAVLYVNAKSPKEYSASGVILAVSCVTDLFDGLIARKFDQISNLGKVLDPIADKATQGVMLICMAKHRPVLWWLLGLFAVKEGFQLIMGCWYLRKGQMLPGALMSGKICTTVLFFCMILLVIFQNMPTYLVFVLIGLCAFFMAVSFLSYIKAYFGKNKKVEKL